jgi:hypothetical protein
MNMGNSINHWAEEIKPYTRLICIILGALILLGLWELSSEMAQKQPVKLINTAVSADGTQTLENTATGDQTVIGSKNGTKYYLPWCGALGRIKPENRVTFATPALARQAGYSPAGNCKGTK